MRIDVEASPLPSNLAEQKNAAYKKYCRSGRQVDRYFSAPATRSSKAPIC